MKTSSLLFIAVGALACQTAYADCTDVIKLSKTVSATLQTRDSIETSAESFCKEYKSSTSASKSANYGISYKFLAASLGMANASESEVASRFCSDASSSNSRSDSYRQYVEQISNSAYTAYEACERMRSSQINFAVAAVLKKTMILVVSNAASTSAAAKIKFTAAGGPTCAWSSGLQTGSTVELATGSSTDLKCDRTDTGDESAITILELTSGKGNSLTIPWAALDANGDPIDHLKLLNKRVEVATGALEAATKSLNKSVVAFALNSCPQGWEVYKEASGRFIRGIDLDEAPRREQGSQEEDAMQGHAHTSSNGFTNGIGKIQPGVAVGYITSLKTSGPVNDGVNGEPRIARETRPKNVALLYCQRK